MRVLVHPKDNLYSLQFVPVEVVYGDVRQDLSDVLKGIDIIFHLASIISITKYQGKLVYSVNVGGTENVLNFAKKKQIPVVYVSSVHAFSEVSPGSKITEDTPIDEDNIVGDYGKSKAIATKMVLNAFKEGLDGFIVFPTGIFGPYDYKWSYFSRVLVKYKEGKLRVTVSGKFDFVDVRDVANSIIKLYELFNKNIKTNHEKFIVSGHDLYFENLPKLCGAKDYKVLSDLPADFVSYLMITANTLFGVPVEFVPYALHTLRLNYTYSHKKLKEAIDYKPRSVEDTINAFFEWIKVDAVKGNIKMRFVS
ncbi:MAG: NAD-dependent epimerase/dehydratase family protein [Fervidobacterium sp.]